MNFIELKKVRFIQNNKQAGQDLDIYVDYGSILVEEVDLANKYISLSDVKIERPFVKIHEYTEYIDSTANAVAIEPATANATVEDTIKFVGKIKRFELIDGAFTLDNSENSPITTLPEDVLDYDHLNVFDVDLEIEDFVYSEWDFRGKVPHLSCESNTGFRLEKLSAEEIAYIPIFEHAGKTFRPFQTYGVMRRSEFVLFNNQRELKIETEVVDREIITIDGTLAC